MLNLDRRNAHLRSRVTLVVIPSLEVTLGCAPRKRRQVGLLPVDRHVHLAALERQHVRKLGVDGHIAQRNHLLVAALGRLVHTNRNITALVIIHLRDGLARLGAENLPNRGAVPAIVGLGHRHLHGHDVGRGFGVPALGGELAELGAAVLAAAGGDTARGGRGAGDFHDDGAGALVGVEVLVGEAVASGELVAGDGVGLAGAAGGELEAELAEVEVAAGGAGRVGGGGDKGQQQAGHEGEFGVHGDGVGNLLKGLVLCVCVSCALCLEMKMKMKLMMMIIIT